MSRRKHECECGGARPIPCATCERPICPACRTVVKLVGGHEYHECKPCGRERRAWNQELRADKNFMRWHEFRRYSPVEEPETAQGITRKIERTKKGMS